jgi:predicted TIM-barrel fold metal-dependent hydrolase
MIDTNIYLSRWPTRRLPCDDTAALVAKLKAAGVVQAWAGSVDALLHNDVSAVNTRLADECAAHGDGLLIPFGTINPLLPDWQEDLRRVHEVHKMPGIRLHPNYHGYKLDAPEFAGLLTAAAERKLLVQFALRMEDPRTQHRLFSAADVDASPLVELLPKFPQLRVQLLNSLNVVRPDLLDRLIAAGNVSVEIAMLEGVGGITNLLKHVPPERVLFGSYFPFFAWESARLKLQESELTQRLRESIEGASAERLLSRANDE